MGVVNIIWANKMWRDQKKVKSQPHIKWPLGSGPRAHVWRLCLIASLSAPSISSGSIVFWPSCDYIFPHSTITLTSALSTHARTWPPWSWTGLWHSIIFLHGRWWSACLAAETEYMIKQLLKASFCLIALEHSLLWKRESVAAASTARKQGDKDTHTQLFYFLFSLGLKLVELYYCSCLRVGLSISIHSRNSLMDMLRGLFPWRS